MIIKNTVKMHSDGLCEGLNMSKGLNKCTPGRAVHILKCSGGVKAGAEGCGVSVGVQIYSSVCRRGPGCGTASAGVLFSPPALSWGGRFSIRPGSHSPKPGKRTEDLQASATSRAPVCACGVEAGQSGKGGGSSRGSQSVSWSAGTAKAGGTWRKAAESGDLFQNTKVFIPVGISSRARLRGCCELFMGSDRV